MIPPYQGGGCRCPPDKGEYPEGGRGFCFSGSRPCFPIGKKTPLDPPLSGGQKALPLRGRLASLSGMEPPLIRGAKALPLRASPSRRGRFVAVVPLIRGIPPKGGGGFVFRGRPCFPSGRKPPLIPPYQGGKKLSPFGVALLPYREWNPLIPPYQGGKSSPPSGESVPKGGGLLPLSP